MRVEILHFGRVYRRILQRIRHREARALAILRRRSDVISVTAHTKADDFGIDVGATLPCVLELLENHGAAAITQHESIAFLVERPARLRRRIIAHRQCLGLSKATEATAGRRHLAATGDDHVGVTVLNRAHSQADGVGRRRTCGDNPEIRAFQAVLDREVTRDHVDNGGRHEERRNLPRTARLQIGAVLLLDRAQAADAGAADGAATVSIELAHVDAGIRHRLNPCGHAVLHELVHAPRVLG